MIITIFVFQGTELGCNAKDFTHGYAPHSQERFINVTGYEPIRLEFSCSFSHVHRTRHILKCFLFRMLNVVLWFYCILNLWHHFSVSDSPFNLIIHFNCTWILSVNINTYFNVSLNYCTLSYNIIQLRTDTVTVVYISNQS